MRTDPKSEGSEFSLLKEYLDYQRETVLMKTAGLNRRQMAQTLPPSSLTLAGLLYHLALVEENWMEVRFCGLADREPWAQVDWEADPEWEFRNAVNIDPDQLRLRYRQACDRSREIVSKANGPHQLSAKPLHSGDFFSLSWIMLHLIEETARHAGHADLLREAVDGEVGE